MDSTVNYISLYSGIAGLDRGFQLAVSTGRAVAYVERDAEAAALLVDRMEAGMLDSAPVWTDSSTFDGEPWRGVVDWVIGGFPCQPWSVAGKRDGASDARWLWPHIKRIIEEAGPGGCFFENVPGLMQGKPYLTVCIDCRINSRAQGVLRAKAINDPGRACDVCKRTFRSDTRFIVVGAGITAILEDLAALGFDAEWTSVRASDVGAPHRRERIFILAYRGRESVQLFRQGLRAEPAGSGTTLANRDGSSGTESKRQLHTAERVLDETGRAQASDRSSEQCRELANTADGRLSDRRPGQPAGAVQADVTGAGEQLAHAGHDAGGAEQRLQHREPDSGAGQPGTGMGDASSIRRKKQSQYKNRSSEQPNSRSISVWPPGPNGDWSAVPPELWPAVKPEVRRSVDGLSHGLARVAKLRMLGNAVVAQQAALAFQELSERLWSTT